MKNYYSILGIDYNTTESELLTKLEHLLFVEHPNVRKTQNDARVEYSEQIEALLLLSKSDVRRKYDLLLKHKNNTEVRHSVKYKTFSEIITKIEKDCKNECEEILRLSPQELKAYYKNKS